MHPGAVILVREAVSWSLGGAFSRTAPWDCAVTAFNTFAARDLLLILDAMLITLIYTQARITVES